MPEAGGRGRLSAPWLLMLAALLASLLLAGCGGEAGGALMGDDLAAARQAATERNWPLAERLLERYLREERAPGGPDDTRQDERWEAWQLLLQVINGQNPEPRASLAILEAMRGEYEDNDIRMADILERTGRACESLRRYGQAAEAWDAYVGLAGIGAARRVEGFRHLAAMQFSQRRFEAGEESLQQCLALPVPDRDKVRCMLDLADQNMARERWQEVSDLCQQILDSEPDTAVRGQAGYLLGDALEQLGQKKEALRQFELARDSYPNPAVMDNRIAYLRKELKLPPKPGQASRP